MTSHRLYLMLFEYEVRFEVFRKIKGWRKPLPLDYLGQCIQEWTTQNFLKAVFHKFKQSNYFYFFFKQHSYNYIFFLCWYLSFPRICYIFLQLSSNYFQFQILPHPLNVIGKHPNLVSFSICVSPISFTTSKPKRFGEDIMLNLDLLWLGNWKRSTKTST